MNRERIENLSKILKRLNEDGATEEVRNEALKIVEEITPIELSIAEQSLIEEGMKPEDLRGLCEIHMEVLKDELNKLKTKIDPGHVISTMVEEHESILGFLTELEELNKVIQSFEKYDKSKEEFSKIISLSENLLDAENHHQKRKTGSFCRDGEGRYNWSYTNYENGT